VKRKDAFFIQDFSPIGQKRTTPSSQPVEIQLKTMWMSYVDPRVFKENFFSTGCERKPESGAVSPLFAGVLNRRG